MLIAVAAWMFHVAAMAVAPLSLVQVVLAGGVVLLAVMAERVFGLRIGRRQWIGLGLTATGLLLLGMTVPGAHRSHATFSAADMIAFQACLIAAGTLLIVGPRIAAREQQYGFMLGAAAGILFGVSDVAIKGVSVIVAADGPRGLLNPWTAVALAASIAAFYASAKGLQDGDAVPVIAITGTAGNVAGIVGGIAVFGDPLPRSPVVLTVQCIAFALVLVAAWLMPAPIHVPAPIHASRVTRPRAGPRVAGARSPAPLVGEAAGRGVQWAACRGVGRTGCARAASLPVPLTLGPSSFWQLAWVTG